MGWHLSFSVALQHRPIREPTSDLAIQCNVQFRTQQTSTGTLVLSFCVICFLWFCYGPWFMIHDVTSQCASLELRRGIASIAGTVIWQVSICWDEPNTAGWFSWKCVLWLHWFNKDVTVDINVPVVLRERLRCTGPVLVAVILSVISSFSFPSGSEMEEEECITSALANMTTLGDRLVSDDAESDWPNSPTGTVSREKESDCCMCVYHLFTHGRDIPCLS